MIILHCIKNSELEKINNSKFYGKDIIDKYGYIHCSSIENFWRVAPKFKDIDYSILCIDTNFITSKIVWEDLEGCGRNYPHIYGLLNTDAIINIYPFIKDDNGKFILNDELKKLN